MAARAFDNEGSRDMPVDQKAVEKTAFEKETQ